MNSPETPQGQITRVADSSTPTTEPPDVVAPASDFEPTKGLVDALFTPVEQVGWEFIRPAPRRPSPVINHPPVWFEPTHPTVDTLRAKYKGRLNGVPAVIAAMILVGIFGFSMIALSLIEPSDGPALLGIACLAAAAVFGAGWFIPLAGYKDDLAEAEMLDARARNELWGQFQAAHSNWQRNVKAHIQSEDQRLTTCPLWYPLRFQAALARVDVFGGVTEGWACLLTTLGSPNLAANHQLLVLDLTEGDIGDGLLTVADQKGLACRRFVLPAGLHTPTVLNGLDNDEIGELLADAVGSTSLAAEGRDLRSVRVHNFQTVTGCLEQPVTFKRIVAGLRILQRRFDPGAAASLTTDEQNRLAENTDSVGRSERTQNEFEVLTSLVELLARDEADLPPEDDYLGSKALTVLASTSANPRRKELTDAVLFHTVLHHLRAGTGRLNADLLVIAGADRMGKDALESLARHARRRHVRVIYLMEHLRDDVNQLIGGADSAAVIMRLGNPDQAATAAKFIGHEHKFVLSQETKGFGETLTIGGGHTYGQTHSTNYGSSPGTSSARSWQQNDTWSRATSANYGLTNGRVYEFRVEPTAIASLPASAFILVDTGPLGRRASLGDCNPGIAGLARVSPHPVAIDQ